MNDAAPVRERSTLAFVRKDCIDLRRESRGVILNNHLRSGLPYRFGTHAVRTGSTHVPTACRPR